MSSTIIIDISSVVIVSTSSSAYRTWCNIYTLSSTSIIRTLTCSI
nr:MAG TPA: hypothetical protein [Bacteriophage sp.]